jgi:hypothetical protein
MDWAPVTQIASISQADLRLIHVNWVAAIARCHRRDLGVSLTSSVAA